MVYSGFFENTFGMLLENLQGVLGCVCFSFDVFSKHLLKSFKNINNNDVFLEKCQDFCKNIKMISKTTQLSIHFKLKTVFKHMILLIDIKYYIIYFLKIIHVILLEEILRKKKRKKISTDKKFLTVYRGNRYLCKHVVSFRISNLS